MNKDELLILIKTLNLPSKEYYILGGGSLVMFGIKDTTNDLDLCVSFEVFEILKEKYKLTEDKKNEYGFYKLSDLIEIIPNKKEDFNCEEVDGFLVETLEQILAFKKKRNAPKDIPYIEKIERHIKEHNTKK